MTQVSSIDPAAIKRVAEQLQQQLRLLQTSDGHWTGKLSASALSTATAISGLSLYRLHADSSRFSSDRLSVLIDGGIGWLARAQNPDGGFGDTERSHSNIATTLLVLAAFHLSGRASEFAKLIELAQGYVDRQGSWEGLKKRYGKDKTFVVPILTNCALAGLVDWKVIPPLPFEAAALPQSWYRFAKMPVVSYAIPALVAMGQAHFHFRPPKNPFVRIVRWLCIPRTLQVLDRMQPESGGYLEAVPLTSFVLMSLAAKGSADLEVAHNAVRFIEDSVLEDGSWPIDTNLATWVTSLASRSILLQPNRERQDALVDERTIRWLLSCQHRVRHPFTGAEPGGWGWTDLSGAVPDADDTPAALLAIADWRDQQEEIDESLSRDISESGRLGVEWLLGLQNRDGGWPTFCRGWGQLPFDRSGSDLTAHAIRALCRWRSEFGQKEKEIEGAIGKGVRYLKKEQREDGSWLPLWFGNQDHPEEENSVYGTSRVLLGLAALESTRFQSDILEMKNRGIAFLKGCQNRDGGWGGGPSLNYFQEISKALEREDSALESTHLPISGRSKSSDTFRTPPESIFATEEGSSSIEETALALEAILACDTQLGLSGFIMPGVEFLRASTEKGWTAVSWPIGFYFAKLWYHEQMYPIVYSLAVFNRLLACDNLLACKENPIGETTI